MDNTIPANLESGLGKDSAYDGNAAPDATKGPFLTRVVRYIVDEATFFRVHLAAFTFIPLIFSAIFFASNGRYQISFLDSLFLCYSAMTVTGLSTVNLSTITTWQQFILYFLMAIGDITIVSWTMVLIRKRFFRRHCEYAVAKRKINRTKTVLRSKNSFMRSISGPIAARKQREPTPRQEKKQDELGTPEVQIHGPTPSGTRANTTTINVQEVHESEGEDDEHVLSDARTFSSSPRSAVSQLPPDASPRSAHMALSPDSERPSNVPYSPNTISLRSPPTIEFAASTNVNPRLQQHPTMTLRPADGRPYPRRTGTALSSAPPTVPGSPTSHHSRKYEGLGGFPSPGHLMQSVMRITAPHAYAHLERRVKRTMTMPTVTTLESTKVPWLKNLNALVVGRNSDFRTETLSDEQLEEVGGAEYRALRLLSYLVPAYFVLWQLVTVILFLPWLASINTYDGVFQAQPKLVTKSWFAFFQIMGAYTGGGLSLVDLGMLPFQNAYLMIVAVALVILAGNHALPIFLRLIIWVAHKILPADSENQYALTFLLDHPRRCFLYLFPSHQTWFLVICLVVFSAIEWVAFEVLNIGLPAYTSIPTGPRVVAGLFQGLAARASGFAIVPLASLAPALQFLYVVMMYIAVYPVAMSIRSTNVYEERSLGVFEAAAPDEDEEPDDLNKIKNPRERIGRYLGWHIRRQMSIDIWWLVWGVFLVAIIERDNLLDESKKWFDLFRILFELVSAFGGIGLSLGFPTDNFSFVGAFHPLSKLVVIVIMVRGRHRGLPVAVDRAVLLPEDMVPSSNASANAAINTSANAGINEKRVDSTTGSLDHLAHSPPIS